MIARNTTSKRLQAAATKLVATATVMLVGVAATHNAHAIERISDAKLADQVGSQKYYTGGCDTTNGRWNCNNADAECHLGAATDLNYTGDDYIDVIYVKPFCLGTLTQSNGCNNTGTNYNTVVRTYYARTAGQTCGSGEARIPTVVMCTKFGCP